MCVLVGVCMHLCVEGGKETDCVHTVFMLLDIILVVSHMDNSSGIQ